jgi:DNA-directed RNA polymerase specialized sigma24 family protein
MEKLTAESFARAYERGSVQTVNFLISKGFPEDEARDAAQAAWVRGWERRHQIREPERVLRWINTIALNLGRTQMRKLNAMQEFEDYATSMPDPTAAIDVAKLLRESRSKDRTLLIRRHLLEWGIDDLARELECSNRAVRVRLHRACKCLRERFGVTQRAAA